RHGVGHSRRARASGSGRLQRLYRETHRRDVLWRPGGQARRQGGRRAMTGERRTLVLVVDDQPANVKLLQQVLSVPGYDVATASSGKEALEKVAAEMPDIVLLDVVMPQMSGYEVCKALRAQKNTALLPIVMVTALDPLEERVKGIEAGADDF